MKFLYHFFKENYKYVSVSIIIFFACYYNLFLGSNFFNSNELDIYVLFNYLSESNLGGWRLDKIIGTNMHIGDPSFNAWSVLSLVYNLPIENKIFLHNVIFAILSFYSSLSLFYLICFANPKLNKIYSILISCLLFISILRLEFNYVFSWLLVYPTIILTCITLFKYFQSQNNKYIFHLFIIFFIGFHFGSIFAIQQSLFFSFIFFLFYSTYFKKNLFIPYFKIIIISLFTLLLTSSWILYPYILEIILSEETFIRTADYKSHEIIQIDLSVFKLFFNTLFGSFLNTREISLPDKDITPFFHWNNTLGVFFNFIFLFYLFTKNTKNFWIYLCKYIILFYFCHIVLSEISPIYYSLNLFIFDTMSWSKVNIELYIFQLLLLSFFLTNKEKILNNTKIKIYYWLIVFYSFIIILFSLDILLNIDFSKSFLSFFINLFLNLFFNLNLENDALNLFVNDLYERIKFIINYKFLLIHLTSLILLQYLILKNKFENEFRKACFVILIILNNFFSISYFTPLEKNNFYLWKNLKESKIIKPNERIMALSQNYLLNLKNEKVDYANLDENEISNWIIKNPIRESKKHYGIMSPPFLSFSSNASFIRSDLLNDNLSLFDNVPKNIKSGFTSESSFEILQEGIYNNNFINNLSINYAYSLFDLKKLNIINENLEPFWNDENLFIYKIKKSLPYYYLPKKISTTNNKFYEYSIDKNEVYLSKDNFKKYKNLKLGPAEYSFKILNNSYFEVNYKSKSENILVISNLYDENWKHTSNKNLKIINVNNYFTGIVLKPGDYKFNLYFDNSKYNFGIYISLISLLLLVYTKFFILRK